MKRFSDRGFTLIELMIVIVIIGILSSLAAFGYSMYMDRARTTRLRGYVVSLAAKQEDAMSRQVMVPFNVGPYIGNEAAYKNVLGFDDYVYPDIEIETQAWTASSPNKCTNCAQYGIPAPPADKAGYYVVARQDMKSGGAWTTVYMTSETPAPVELNVGE